MEAYETVEIPHANHFEDEATIKDPNIKDTTSEVTY